MWDKPKRVMSKEDWAENQADGAPPGTFMPNMSAEDVAKWKAKLVGHKTSYPQVEIRKDSTVVILSLKGYKYKYYDTRRSQENLDKIRQYDKKATYDKWPLIHIASAGPMVMSFEDLDEFKQAIDEGIEFLRNLDK